MKYRPAPLNILAVVVTVKYIVLFIRILQGGQGKPTGQINAFTILLELFIPIFFLAIDYALQKELRIKKYIWVLLVELTILVILGVVLYYGYNFRTLYQLGHFTIFDGAM